MPRIPTVESTPGSTRIRGLDGLRAVGALFVIVFHLIPAIGGAGFIGVDMFFVISGFLITALLLKEHATTGRIDLRAFLRRRYRRLVPAVVVMVVVSVALARAISDDAVVQTRWQALGALTGTYNWFQIANGSSYFESREPLLLTNMWSLAVEQQFYLVWPLVVIGLLKTRRLWHGTLAVIGLTSLGLHAWFATGDVTRAYVGTDSHIFGLMIGAAIAFALPGIMTGRTRTASALWGVAGWLGLVGLTVVTFAVPDAAWFYPWGLLLASALAGLVVRAMLPDVVGSPAHSLANVMDSAPMVWIGQRSYGIYLWHWPLWVLATYHLKLAALPAFLIVFSASLLAAHLSFAYVETPIRRLGVLPWLRRLRTLSPIAVTWISVATLVITTTFTVALVASKDMTEAQAAVAAGAKALATHKPGQAPSTTPPPPTDQPTAQPEPAPSTPMPSTPAPATKQPVTGEHVTVIGDSVTLAAAPALIELYPGAVVDGEISRSVKAFKSVAQVYAAKGQLRDVVVISLGTNGAISMELARDIMGYLGPDRKVIWVTAQAPRARWVPRSNATIAEIAKEYPAQIRIADWAVIAQAHPEFLASDGIHPGTEGRKHYAAEIKRAIDSF
ncbi:acyltransferase family protein [Trueperella pyogenes]|uniref:acyltransferase family protein n=1 Tax=Trueperella pyogenes TaxID=1661 RepID=UPI00339D489D